MDEFVDSSINSNYKVLPDLLESLNREKEKLRKQVLGLNVDGFDQRNEWDEIATETRTTISELNDLLRHCDELQQSISGENSCWFTTDQKIISKLQEFDDVIRLHDYLLLIKRINQISKDVSSLLRKGNVDSSVTMFLKFVDLFNSLSSTSCSHLKEFTRSVCEDLRTQLIDVLSNQYNKFLKIMSWPLTKDVSIKNLQTWKKKESEFALCFRHLIAIEKIKYLSSEVSIPELDDPLILPLELLVAPLRKRFRYHFYGDKKTNAKHKPEWYFTQVSQWISSHSQFLINHIQPFLNGTPYNFLNVKVEFTRALIQELVKKINHELNPTLQTINNDYLFSHLIDELLLFDKELHTQQSYPLVYPRCIIIAQEEKILCRWRNLEKQIAAEKLKAIMESSSAWELARSSLVGEHDGIKIPECGERFMLLLSSISERYKQIPILMFRLQFLELQTDLLLEFSHDLSQAIKRCGSTPFTNEYIAYLNASTYIASVLRQWGEETFFVELHYYHKFVSQNHCSDSMETIAQLEVLRKVDFDFADLEGSAFDKVIEVFDCLCTEIIETISSYSIEHLKPAISTFKKNRWQNLPIVSDSLQVLEVSSSALDFLVQLQHLLYFFKTNITEMLQNRLFECLIRSLDDFLLNYVIFSNTFSRGGCEQIYFDISQVIKPLVADSLKELYSSSTILRRTSDACCILKQPSSYSTMLRKLSQLAINHKDDSAFQEVMSLLKEKGVTCLTLEEVLKVTTSCE